MNQINFFFSLSLTKEERVLNNKPFQLSFRRKQCRSTASTYHRLREQKKRQNQKMRVKIHVFSWASATERTKFIAQNCSLSVSNPSSGNKAPPVALVCCSQVKVSRRVVIPGCVKFIRYGTVSPWLFRWYWRRSCSWWRRLSTVSLRTIQNLRSNQTVQVNENKMCEV